jgi:hypothetical protein
MTTNPVNFHVPAQNAGRVRRMTNELFVPDMTAAKIFIAGVAALFLVALTR